MSQTTIIMIYDSLFQSPYAVVNLPSEECVQKIASRAILVR